MRGGRYILQVLMDGWMRGSQPHPQSGKRLDMVIATQHGSRIEQLRHMPCKADIQVVREGMHWYLIERYYGQFDFFLIVLMLCGHPARRPGDLDAEPLWRPGMMN